MLIAVKAWSDFAANIPLIRSFSFGVNFPPQYPIFPGLPIHYHFLFYFLVGKLEQIGLPINIALNIPSALGFFALLFLIYLWAKNFFASKIVGIFSVLFFLFNGSLSFLYFFQKNPLSNQTIFDIVTNKTFPSFGPYDGKIVSAFWNMNIYTNQRHLAISYAFSLFLLYIVLPPIFKNKKQSIKISAVLGVLLGASFFLHMAVFLINIIVLSLLFIQFSKIRKSIFIILAIGGFLALPQYLYVQGAQTAFKPALYFGYLVTQSTSAWTYWLYNLGLHIIFIPIGFLLAPKNLKKVFVSVFPVFILANCVIFSKEIAANHKFINYFMIFGNMFSAYALVFLWKKKWFLKPIVIVSIFFLLLSGIIDFFPIYNDTKITLSDYPNNKNASWIMQYTPKNSVFLNTTFLYDPASLAGRKIYLGWPYFPWSAGYDTNARGREMAQMLGATDKTTACNLLEKNHIDFIEIDTSSKDNPDIPPVSSIFEKQFVSVYSNSPSYFIYDVSKSCTIQ